MFPQLSTQPGSLVQGTILAHKHANAAHLGASERLWRLIEAVDPDLDFNEDNAVRTALTAHYGAEAPAKIDELLTSRDVSSALGDAEDAAWEAFEATPLTTADEFAAYTAYVKAHASTLHGAEAVYLRRAMDWLTSFVGARTAA